MNTIKIKSLEITPVVMREKKLSHKWETPQQAKQKALRNIRRVYALASFMENSFSDFMLEHLDVSIDTSIAGLARVFIYPKHGALENSETHIELTKQCEKYCFDLKSKGWGYTRSIRDDGSFFSDVLKYVSDQGYYLFFEQSYNYEGCKVEKIKKTIEIYKSTCDGDN